MGKIIEKYQLGKWFQRDNLVILVLMGILLVVIVWPTQNQTASKTDVLQNQNNVNNPNNIPVNESISNSPYEALYDYTEYLEKKLENALVDMKGVGRVKVLITLDTSAELVVEKDEPMVRNNTTENDKDGGSRIVYQMDAGESTVYEKQGSNETPYVTKTILPKISGILILAEGAGTGNVSKNISEIAQALFGIEAHKVRVATME